MEKERDELRLRARRKIPEDERSLCKEQIAGKSAELKNLRKEINLINDIRDRSETISERLNEVSKEKHKEVQR